MTSGTPPWVEVLLPGVWVTPSNVDAAGANGAAGASGGVHVKRFFDVALEFRGTLCHGDRSWRVEHNPWRSFVQGVGWLFVALSTSVPLLGLALWYLPLSGPLVEAVVPWMMVLPLYGLLLELGALLVILARIPIPATFAPVASLRGDHLDG